MKSNKDIYPEDLPPMRTPKVTEIYYTSRMPLRDWKQEMRDADRGRETLIELVICILIGAVLLMCIYWR